MTEEQREAIRREEDIKRKTVKEERRQSAFATTTVR